MCFHGVYVHINYLFEDQRDGGALGESREGPAAAPLWLLSPTRQRVNLEVIVDDQKILLQVVYGS
ncbi:hypothetical protein CWC18_13275 [Pseudoalteromonas aurantia]|uniref:Uncharacterized protein n=1 Tax=Pseudoalteromonas aurantia TaxID=43654 RepID=A0ABY2VZR2_9GAMM|nr:hypothetical protein CWC18_13275 [Pseudoalteromonas aurantia]TMO76103.1 hypothetical protein CWC20_06270 [Pseudoalteromonas aurantia]